MLHDDRASLTDIVVTIRSDAALTMAVLRAAGEATAEQGAYNSVPAAVKVLSHRELEAVAKRLPVYDFFDRAHLLATEAARLRIHGTATQRAAQRIRDELGLGVGETVAVAALLHDIGKVALAHAYDDYGQLLRISASPDTRLRLERETLGIDHATAGAVLARRFKLPESLVTAIGGHHDPDAQGDAAVIRLADMVAHYAAGQAVEPDALIEASEAVELSPGTLRRVLFNPVGPDKPGRAELDPCPLSSRQLEILRLLGQGMLYKQIAGILGINQSTVRTHLHNTYAALGVLDRAQAVLLATQRGWI
jgi:putative nucleotidyltransferase with HDIG domain